MSLVQTEVTANEEKHDHKEIAERVLAAMTPDERAELAKESGTLHFRYLLGLQSKKADRKGKNNQSFASFKPVGVSLVSDKDITVPQIHILKDKDTGIDKDKDITYINIPANQPFDLSYYEFMYLMIGNGGYDGFCSLGKDPRGVCLRVKMSTFNKATTQVPTPTINFTTGGSPKENMIAIDVKGVDGSWHIKDDYAEKFGPLLTTKRVQRSTGGIDTIPTPIATAVALGTILGVRDH